MTIWIYDLKYGVISFFHLVRPPQHGSMFEINEGWQDFQAILLPFGLLYISIYGSTYGYHYAICSSKDNQIFTVISPANTVQDRSFSMLRSSVGDC